MKEERVKRYWDKINLISKRTDEINEWANTEPEEFIANEKTKLATYKAFQELAEASMDIVAMICKDTKILPKDDYTNIELLKKEISFNEKVLIEANGLRNRVVHRYNKTDDLLAFESIKELLPGIVDFVGEVKAWMRKRLKK
ncbi:MAG: DUF86 domain-containing protein [Euryarchaeota archaeon]|nr:DUF86 domain-containing protein [Euryarchaeota archaeon]